MDQTADELPDVFVAKRHQFVAVTTFEKLVAAIRRRSEFLRYRVLVLYIAMHVAANKPNPSQWKKNAGTALDYI